LDIITAAATRTADLLSDKIDAALVAAGSSN